MRQSPAHHQPGWRACPRHPRTHYQRLQQQYQHDLRRLTRLIRYRCSSADVPDANAIMPEAPLVDSCVVMLSKPVPMVPVPVEIITAPPLPASTKACTGGDRDRGTRACCARTSGYCHHAPLPEPLFVPQIRLRRCCQFLTSDINVSPPLVPNDGTSADWIVTLPDDALDWPVVPLTISMSPPLSSELLPAATRTLPPAPLLPVPTSMSTPPAPSSLDFVSSRIVPDEPSAETPVPATFPDAPDPRCAVNQDGTCATVLSCTAGPSGHGCRHRYESRLFPHS